MNKMLLLIVFLIISNGKQLNAQRLQKLFRETITINSRSSTNGHTRNISKLELPTGTSGFVYRISVFKRKDAADVSELMDIVSEIPITELKVGAKLSKYAIKNTNSLSIDYFIFTTEQDALDFYDKKDNNWSSCTSFLNRAGTCSSTSACLNKNVWFGFRNNNISQGLDIVFEAIAIVDEAKEKSNQSTYVFNITNTTNSEVFFQLSNVGKNWNNFSLTSNSGKGYSYKKNEIIFRMLNQNNKELNYKIYSDERYKIVFNQNNELDLQKY